MTKTLEERFWEKVNVRSDDECWEWMASKTDGYGRFGTGKVLGTKISHRISYMFFYKTKIPNGLDVLHKCDNPPCCNPRHLFLGTARDNIVDMIKKGRGANVVGERNPNSKISRITVWKVFILHEFGYSNLKIAKKIGLGESSVSRIVNGAAWKFVKEVFYA